MRSSSVSSTPGQEPHHDDLEKNEYINIDSLRQEYEKLKALIEEKEALLRHQSKYESNFDAQNEQHEPDNIKLVGTTSTEDSNEAHQQPVTVRGTKEKQIINKIGRRRGGAEWEKYIDGNDTIKTSELLWYLPPIQRQRCFDDLILPQIDAGDVFFDIIYGGAASNLVALLSSTVSHDQTLRTFIHFFGSLGALWMCWEAQTFYEGRYLTYDYFHRLVGIIRYLCIGFAIFNIAPLSLYTAPQTGNVMVFTLAMLLEFMLSMGLALELYYRGLGDRIAIENQTYDDFKFRNWALLVLYITAFIISAVQYVQANKEIDRCSKPICTTVLIDDQTVKDRAIWDAYDLPMTLNTVAYLSRFILAWVRIWKDKRDARDSYVPTNIDYLIDRYEGFIMVLMGVGVLSLLTVDQVSSREYYVTVICGMLTMIFLHVLKMESESNSSNHALRRGPIPSELYIMLVHILTISLIGFGVSYNVFIQEIFQHDYGEDVGYFDFARYPFLTITIISLELLTVTNCGLKEVLGHVFRRSEGKRRLQWPVVFVTMLKLGSIIFCTTLYTWTNDPETVAACGFGAVFLMFVTHLLNSAFIDKTTLNEDMHNGEKHRTANEERSER